jgi:hypothetical protein
VRRRVEEMEEEERGLEGKGGEGRANVYSWSLIRQ